VFSGRAPEYVLTRLLRAPPRSLSCAAGLDACVCLNVAP